MLTTWHPLSPALIEWVTYTQVMTERLKAYYAKVEMSILAHQWEQPNEWERSVLKIFDERLIRRDIVVKGDDMPCWFARTMIPLSTYQRAPGFFDQLQQVPLAKLIYEEPRVKRIFMHSYGINAQSVEYHWVDPEWLAEDTNLSMRLSTFSFLQEARFFVAPHVIPSVSEESPEGGTMLYSGDPSSQAPRDDVPVGSRDDVPRGARDEVLVGSQDDGSGEVRFFLAEIFLPGLRG